MKRGKIDMPQLTIWDSFSKRSNSTKRPTGAGKTVNCALKEGTSLMSPVFELSGVESAVNYAQFEGRYYFVNDIIQNTNHMYELHCTADILATYRDAIASYNTFVERSASSYDNLINDSYLTQRQTITRNAQAVTGIIDNYSVDGCYFVRTISGDGIIGFWLTSAQYQNLINYLFDDTNFTAELADTVTKTFFNPFQYIVSCKWFPYDASALASAGLLQSVNVPFGWWTSNVQGFREYRPGIGHSAVLNLPSGNYTDWRKFNAEFSRYHILLPGVGVVPLDPMETDKAITVRYNVDFLTGQAQVTVEHTAEIISQYAATMGIDVQIGQLKGADPITTSLDLVGGVGGGIVAGLAGDIFGGIMQGVNTVVNTTKNVLSPTPSLLGSGGNICSLRTYSNIIVNLAEYGSAEYPITVIGRPLYQYARLGNLSGFVKCGAASIDISGFAGERDEVNNMLNSGFYME